MAMQHMEIIQVCPLNEECRREALHKAREYRLDPGLDNACKCVWTQKHRDGDVMIVLYAGSGAEYGERSVEGLQIAEYFSRYGWVSHTVWYRA